jgi:hypothetical protein
MENLDLEKNVKFLTSLRVFSNTFKNNKNGSRMVGWLKVHPNVFLPFG